MILKEKLFGQKIKFYFEKKIKLLDFHSIKILKHHDLSADYYAAEN